ncbi:MAG: class I SAM-dependent methyltransferase, partial [Pseudomonadota bacterium]
LTGVPETMLWPLWNRAAEQSRRDPLIVDPLAAELVERLDYDFAGTFGRPHVFHAIRARLSDDLIADYAGQCEREPVVVSLGDGLETQPWRIADNRIRWLSVDLPEAIATRNELLPPHRGVRTVACSALDPAWTAEIPEGSTPFVSAAGLLMYFQPDEVVRLLADIADRLPNATIFFDTIPPYFSRKTLRGLKVTRNYTAPKMPWGVSVDDIPDFLNGIPGLSAGRIWTYADPYPKRTRLYHMLARIGPVRRRLAGGLALARTTRKTREHYSSSRKRN